MSSTFLQIKKKKIKLKEYISRLSSSNYFLIYLFLSTFQKHEAHSVDSNKQKTESKGPNTTKEPKNISCTLRHTADLYTLAVQNLRNGIFLVC